MLTDEAAVAEIARQCPGFSDAEYRRAFLRGLVETR